MNTVFARIVGIIALISVSCFFVAGQATTGTISVTVSDPIGAPIQDAVVTLKPKQFAAGGAVSLTTDDDGKVDLYNVSPGVHVITIEATNFGTYADDVAVYSGETARVSAMLSVGGSGSSVVVIVDNIEIKPDAIVVTEDDKPLPDSPTYRSLLDIVPSVRLEPLAAGISIDGSTEPDNTYFIDGQEVTNASNGVLNRNYELPWTLVQEVSVRSGTETAQYGGSIGGVVNIVTRGGNNDWHGEVGFSFMPQGLNGGSRPFLNRYGSGAGQIEYFQPNKDDSAGYFPIGSMASPLVNDKFWFFGSYAPQILKNKRTIDYYNSVAPGRTVTQTIDYEQTVRDEFAFVRLDAQPAKTVKASGRYLWNPTVQDGRLPSVIEGLGGVPQAGNGLSGAAFLATGGGRNNSNFVTGDVTWTPNSVFFVGFRAGYNFLNEKLDSYGIPNATRYICSAAGNPQNVPGSNCSPGFDSGVNYLNNLSSTTRKNISVDAGITGINNFGRHQVRFGYQFDRVGRKVDQGYVNSGIIQLFYGRSIESLGVPVSATPGNLGSGFLQRFGVVGDVKGSNQAIYGQDSVLFANRVLVNFGIRFEKEDIPQYGHSEKVDFGWSDKISPRIGFAADIFGNGKTRVYGSYYWNYDRMKLDYFEGLGAQVFFRDFFELLPARGAAFNAYTFANILGNDPNANRAVCPIVNPPGYSVCRFDFRITTNLLGFGFPEVFVIDPGLRPTRQKTWSFGVDQEIGIGFEVIGRFIHKDLDNIIDDQGVFNEQGSEAYILGNVGEGIPCQISSDANFPCPRGERRYEAVNIGIRRRSSDYFFHADYIWSRLVGSYSGLASSDESGRVAPNSAGSFDLPFLGFTANGVEDNGKLATDRPHVFKAYGGYDFKWKGGSQKTSVSAFTTVQSGTPLTTFYNLYSHATSILFGRGDLGRTEKFTETDLRLAHNFGIGTDKKYRIEIFSDILNLFDEKNELARQTTISATNFRSSQLTAGGCTTCQNEPLVIHTIFNAGGIQQYVQNYIAANGIGNAGLRNDYNLPNRFQLPRSMRFGVNIRF